MAADRQAAIRRVLILVLLYSLPAVVVMKPAFDLDIWWHLRTGEWIVEHGALPTTDVFSNYGLGKPWVVYSWLFDVSAFGLYRGFGLSGIILLRVVLTYAVAIAIHRLVSRRVPRFIPAVGLTCLALFAIAPLMTERPWLATVLFWTLTLDAVLGLRGGRPAASASLLPLWYAIWANMHIQFIYGLSVLALACVAPVIDRLSGLDVHGRHGGRAGSREWWRLVALSAACLLATLLNPYHFSLYAQIAEYAGQSRGALGDIVSELRAPSFRSPCDWAMLGLVGAAAFALGRRPRPSSFELLLLTAAAYVSFRSGRDSWFAVLASVAILGPALRPARPGADRFVMTRERAALVAAGVAVALAVAGRVRDLSERGLERRVKETFPAEAAAVVEARGDSGPLYNSFDWGGYLVWRLRTIPVSMDGRGNVHGDERIARSYRTWSGEGGWQSDPELAAANLVIAGPGQALASLLRLDPRFELVHEDPVAVVFVARRAAATEARGPGPRPSANRSALP